MTPKTPAVLALLALLAWSVPAGAQSPQTPAEDPPADMMGVRSKVVTEDGTVVATLDNGLRIVIRATRTVPVVTVRSYVHTGGMYEGPWLGAGISHLVEHLVAKGAVHEMPGGGAAPPTEDAPAGRDRVDEIGGQSNASTSMEWTQYYISAAASRAMDCIDLIADWMARPDITREDFEREHGVVQRELEMSLGEPGREMWRAHSVNIFGDHPASVPVIGYARPLSELTYQDVLDYHALTHVPQNMIFLIVGDVDPEAALRRVRERFAGFQAGREFSRKLPDVQPLVGVRRVVQPNPNIRDVRQYLAFQTIDLRHEDLYALDVLSYILSHGDASRLPRELRRNRQLVTEISTFSWTPAWGRGFFNVAFHAEPQHVEAAEQAVLEELRRVIDQGVSDEELARAKRQKHADLVHARQTSESLSATLGLDMLSTADVNFSRLYVQRIQDVTAEQVRDVAARYFDFERMAITRLVPEEGFALAGDQGGQRRDENAALIRLPNGLRVILQPVPDAGLVSMSFVAEGGLLLEDEQTNGLGNLMARLSTQGAGDRSAEEISAFFSDAGGALSGNMGNNSFYWEATVLSDSFPQALAILSDVVIRPQMHDAELEILRPSVLSAIARINETWTGELNRFWRERFFPDSPYGLHQLGRAEIVRSADSQTLRDYHGRVIRGSSSVLAVFGEFDVDQTRQAVLELFAALPEGQTRVEVPQVRQVAADGELHVLQTEKPVAGVIVAQPGMRITHVEDRIPITVLDTIISGYRLPSGWLHTELRGRQLVYVVHAYNWTGLAPGAFVTYAAGQPENAGEIVSTIHRNLRRAAEYTPTQQEIDRAVNTIVTAELLGNQELSSLAMQSALDELYGLGYDFYQQIEARYRAVTPEDVARVGRQYLSGGYVTVVTTPQPEALEGP